MTRPVKNAAGWYEISLVEYIYISIVTETAFRSIQAIFNDKNNTSPRLKKTKSHPVIPHNYVTCVHE